MHDGMVKGSCNAYSEMADVSTSPLNDFSWSGQTACAKAFPTSLLSVKHAQDPRVDTTAQHSCHINTVLVAYRQSQ
jgi:hypothetical protein